jgi:hypothetical protein
LQKDVYDVGGPSLLSRYNSSISLLLQSVYPQYDWLPWKFTTCPRHYWEEVKNQRKFMEWAGKQLNVKEMSDWYKVTVKVRIFPEFS